MLSAGFEAAIRAAQWPHLRLRPSHQDILRYWEDFSEVRFEGWEWERKHLGHSHLCDKQLMPVTCTWPANFLLVQQKPRFRVMVSVTSIKVLWRVTDEALCSRMQYRSVENKMAVFRFCRKTAIMFKAWVNYSRVVYESKKKDAFVWRPNPPVRRHVFKKKNFAKTKVSFLQIIPVKFELYLKP
jgi:hypothetical protein